MQGLLSSTRTLPFTFADLETQHPETAEVISAGSFLCVMFQCSLQLTRAGRHGVHRQDLL